MFTSLEFIQAWKEWKEHKEEKHGSPYTSVSERKALARLFKEAHGIEELAIASIDDSITGNWAKIYIKKDFQNGQQQPIVGQAGFRSELANEFDKRYGG